MAVQAGIVEIKCMARHRVHERGVSRRRKAAFGPDPRLAGRAQGDQVACMAQHWLAHAGKGHAHGVGDAAANRGDSLRRQGVGGHVRDEASEIGR